QNKPATRWLVNYCSVNLRLRQKQKDGGSAMPTFEELKAKYQTALDVVQKQQVSVQNLHLQDGKLFIKGTAPSLDAANKVWDESKRINPRLDDITADFPVDPSRQQQSAQSVSTYTVKAGDTLS